MAEKESECWWNVKLNHLKYVLNDKLKLRADVIVKKQKTKQKHDRFITHLVINNAL